MKLPDFLIEDGDGYIHVRGHRIGLQDLVHFYNQGEAVEMLWCRFPTLPLAVVHKVIAFYLENQAEVDAYRARCQPDIEKQRAAAAPGPSLAELRRRLETSRPAQGA